jgi:hypothetical protein
MEARIALLRRRVRRRLAVGFGGSIALIRGTDSLSEFGVKWMSSSAKRQCGRALPGRPGRWRGGQSPPSCSWPAAAWRRCWPSLAPGGAVIFAPPVCLYGESLMRCLL